MIDETAAILTDNGFVPVGKLGAGDVVKNPFLDGSAKVVSVVSLEIEACSSGGITLVALPRKGSADFGPDNSTVVFAEQQVFQPSQFDYFEAAPARCFPGAQTMRCGSEIKVCMPVFERPTLFCANGLLFESLADSENPS